MKAIRILICEMAVVLALCGLQLAGAGALPRVADEGAGNVDEANVCMLNWLRDQADIPGSPHEGPYTPPALLDAGVEITSSQMSLPEPTADGKIVVEKGKKP